MEMQESRSSKKKWIIIAIIVIIIIVVILGIRNNKSEPMTDAEKSLQEKSNIDHSKSDGQVERAVEKIRNSDASDGRKMAEIIAVEVDLPAVNNIKTREIDDISVLTDKEFYGNAQIGHLIVTFAEGIVVYDPEAKKVISKRLKPKAPEKKSAPAPTPQTEEAQEEVIEEESVEEIAEEVPEETIEETPEEGTEEASPEVL